MLTLQNPYQPNPFPWKWVGIGVAVLVGGGIVFYATRAKAREPWHPPAPGEIPLRPPPSDAPKSPGIPMGPPGPLASELAAWIDEQDDDELSEARAGLPPHWWEMFIVAAQMPSDDQFLIALNPLLVDLAVMAPDQQSELKSTLVSAVGILDAMALQKIFEKAQAARAPVA